jgi:signal transduction histidine kinase
MSDTDALLETIEAPRIASLGIPVLAVGSAVVIVMGSQSIDGQVRPSLLLMVGVMLLPWLIMGSGRELPWWTIAGVVLAPPVVEAVVELAMRGREVWSEDDLFSFGSSSSIYLVMVMVLSFGFSPGRELVVVIGASVTVYLFRSAVEADPIMAVSTMLALSFVTLACVGVRVGAIGIARAQRATVARDAVDHRRLIARDVHDVVTHTLAVTMLHVTVARMALLRADTGDAVEALEEAERSGRASLADVRRIIRLLRSETETALDAAQPGLGDVPALVESYRAAGLLVAFEMTGPLDTVPPAAGLALYRVAQAALANAARHGTGRAAVDLVVDPADRVELAVRNPVAQAAGSASIGSGMRSMRERVEAAGGTIVIGPDGGGWRVHVILAPVASTPMEATGATR